MDDVIEAFSGEGPLARTVEGFAPRAQQIEMAVAVRDALEDAEPLVVEAGTGTGKTFAYLVPVLLSGQKTIISTGTRHLQDQLFFRDFPRIRDALGVGLKGSILKGRANYLCIHRMHLALSGASGIRSKELARVSRWAEETAWGDISELSGIEEDSPVWPAVTSTSDNCLGGECEYFDRCHVVKARKKAQEADVLVVNHHLFFADMMLKEEGFGELLPGAETFVLDEAHQLADTATRFFGQRLGSRQILSLSRDIQMELLKDAADTPGLDDLARSLEKAALDARLAFGQGMSRGHWADLESRPDVIDGLNQLRSCLQETFDQLDRVADHTRGLESCWRRAEVLGQSLDDMLNEGANDQVRWYETFTRSFSIHRTPLDIAPIFRERMAAFPANWIFTSATLSVSGDFGHFCGQLGLDAPHTLEVESPFDYSRNALMYLPSGLPEPNDRAYALAVAEHCAEIVQRSRGRAFLLFTSFAGMNVAADYLEGRIDYPLLVQGTAPRTELLDRFRALGDAVLLGTSSFWEGVDVRGPALSCVVIDKLPFASPGDPVLKARIESLRQQQINAFMKYQIPEAAIVLKQGIGRLIRDVDDRGCLVICDPRLKSKPYGRIFLNSLPEMPVTRNLDALTQFFNEEATEPVVDQAGEIA